MLRLALAHKTSPASTTGRGVLLSASQQDNQSVSQSFSQRATRTRAHKTERERERERGGGGGGIGREREREADPWKATVEKRAGNHRFVRHLCDCAVQRPQIAGDIPAPDKYTCKMHIDIHLHNPHINIPYTLSGKVHLFHTRTFRVV